MIEKENKFVRFHAMQSIILSVAATVMGFVPLVGLLASLAYIVLWIVMMIKAYNGEKFKLPIIGDIAEKNA